MNCIFINKIYRRSFNTSHGQPAMTSHVDAPLSANHWETAVDVFIRTGSDEDTIGLQ